MTLSRDSTRIPDNPGAQMGRRLAKDRLTECRGFRRANLDAMWAREPTTVGGNLREVKETSGEGKCSWLCSGILGGASGPISVER